MNREVKSTEEILRESLGQFKKISPEEMFSAGTQAMRYLGLQDREHILAEKPAAGIARPVRRTSWFAAAAIVAAVALAVLLPSRIVESAPAVLEDASGTRKIQYGEIVRSSDDMNAMLAMAGGARIEMRSMSELSLERAEDGVRIRLNNGGLIVDAAAQHAENLYVQTKDMVASVTGAVSLVKAEEQGSRVAAIGGEVRVQQGLIEKTLRSGEQVATNPKMESISVKEELAWSREAIAHTAMLQQATPPTPSTPSQPPKEERLAFEVATIRPAVPPPAPAGPNARGGGGNGGAACPGIQLDPRRITIRNASLYGLVALAYGPCEYIVGRPLGERPVRLSGGPDWIKTDRWEIEALIPEGSVDPLPTTPFGGPVKELLLNRSPKVQKMIRALLEERFKVVVRREMKEMPVYVLTVAPGGPKFQGNAFDYGVGLIGAGMLAGVPAAERQAAMRSGALKPMTAAEGAQSVGSGVGPCLNTPGWYGNGGQRQSGQPSCAVFKVLNEFVNVAASELSDFVGRPILDRTGIQERVSFAIDWIPGPLVPGQFPQPISFQELFKALEPIGLQVKEDPRGLVEFFVIERAEKPTEN